MEAMSSSNMITRFTGQPSSNLLQSKGPSMRLDGKRGESALGSTSTPCVEARIRVWQIWNVPQRQTRKMGLLTRSSVRKGIRQTMCLQRPVHKYITTRGSIRRALGLKLDSQEIRKR